MVTVYSQYRKHFKDPLWDEFAISEYNRKKDYRIGRRSVEHRHQPLQWDSSGSDVDTESAIATHKDARIYDLPHKSRHRFAKTNGEAKGSNEVYKPSEHIRQARRSDSDQRLIKEMTTQTTKRQHSKHYRKSKRSKTRRKRINNKDDGQCLISDNQELNGRVPFAAYGWANQAPLGEKYTHNVKANRNDVYPASLRALKRREVDIAKRVAEHKKAHLEYDERTKEKFFNLSQVSPVFITEYQRSFCNIASDKTGYVW